MTTDGFPDLPPGCAVTGKTILPTSLADHVIGFMAVKPRIIEAVKAMDGRSINCPICGAPSASYGGAGACQDGKTVWHTGFQCDECGFAYRE